MILTVSSVGPNGQVVLGSWHVAADAAIVVQRDEAEYPDPSTYEATGRRELIELPPPNYAETDSP